MKLKKGDTVIVTAGKDKGKTGKISRAFPRRDLVLIEGVNVVKRHRRPTRQNQHGQIVERAMPVDVSNVSLVDPKENTPTRIGYTVRDNKKVRIAKKSGSVI
jgi:large subunit ribosomal protein L24